MKLVKYKLTDISSPKQWKSLSMSEMTTEGYPVYSANGFIGRYKEFNHINPTITIGCRGTCGTIHITEPKSYITSNAMALDDLDEEKVVKMYLYYALKQYDFRKITTGTSQPQITKEGLQKVVLNIPVNKEDQLHIANLLSKAENLIAQRKESICLLNEFLKSSFLDTFGDPVKNEKYWKTIPFLDAGKFNSGGTPSKERADYWDGTYPWVSPKDMKVSKIVDSQDHISSIVFQETNLKRIPRNHLLIVVRGMILAHSFPVAINDVEVAINQDMKAILPKNNLNIVFLEHCLGAMKRQILDLISTAGHGTRKFDTSAMKKLLIPIPPLKLQTQFAQIVEKTEALKTQYQQSLQELENLYDSLGQKAFNGELSQK